jgi:hypothetical protein
MPEPESCLFCYCRGSKQPKEATMPVLIVPLLVGIPVLIGGGYIIYHFVK